jgi:hypothetical protein
MGGVLIGAGLAAIPSVVGDDDEDVGPGEGVLAG